jgi:hypothetical protein
VYALKASTGAFLWKYPTDGEVLSSPAVANGMVYVGSDDYNLYALNAKTGVLVWSFTTAYDPSSPTVANGLVYVGAAGSMVYALNASSGAQLWNYATDGGMYSAPAVVIRSGVCSIMVWYRVRAGRQHRHPVVELPNRGLGVFLARCGEWDGLYRLVQRRHFRSECRDRRPALVQRRRIPTGLHVRRG